MKKIVSALLAAAMLFGAALSASAAAKTQDKDWTQADLSKLGQGIYQDFVKGLHNMQGTVTSDFSGTSQQAFDQFSKILQVLKKQNPEIFWLSYDYQSCKVTGGDTLSWSPDYFSEFKSGGKLDKEKIKSVQQSLEAVVNSVGTGKTTYETVTKFNSWLTQNVAYTFDYSNSHVYELTGALVDRKCACEGYAKAFKFLCDNAGIECVVVSGKGTTGGTTYDHEWNYVKMDDGKWYLMDCTWNALSANKQKWFLLGTDSAVEGMALLTSHKEDGSKYPELSKANYSAQ